MNALQEDLLRDQVLAAASRKKRQRAMGLIAAPLILFPAIGFFTMQSERSEPATIDQTIAVAPAAEQPHKLIDETLETEEELLARLAHLGPVMVTDEAGNRWLYLTNEDPIY